MILIVHGTNRRGSLSKPLTDFVTKYLNETSGEEVESLDLAEIPIDTFDSVSMYQADRHSSRLMDIQNRYVFPASKMVFISQEYNGSIPGILKLFIDACSVADSKKAFYHKKALLIGVASGRAGNLRGMEHLTGILMYLNMIVYPNRLPVSRIEHLIDEQSILADLETRNAITRLLDQFIRF
jgi:NAD(P)H-dependent FMN reductase